VPVRGGGIREGGNSLEGNALRNSQSARKERVEKIWGKRVRDIKDGQLRSKTTCKEARKKARLSEEKEGQPDPQGKKHNQS